MDEKSLKADLHVHSKYSTRPSEWVLRKIGCSESYTDPLNLYRLARAQGMDLVTITDHNSLAGSLDIAHLDNTFLSEEITTYFPKGRCKLHVLAYHISEAQHRDITRVRENVFDLAAYLNAEAIFHAVAHPLFSINDRLTLNHLEQMLILFQNFELNGTRDDFQNRVLTKILKGLTRRDMDRICDKHGLTAPYPEPWKKNLVGGSDDHSSLTIANTYTEVAGVSSLDAFLEGIGRGRARIRGGSSSPKLMARNLYSIAYQFYKDKFSLDRYVNKDVLFKFTDRALIPRSKGNTKEQGQLRRAIRSRHSGSFFSSTPKTLRGLLQKEARDIIFGDHRMNDLLKGRNDTSSPKEDLWFQFVNATTENILSRCADTFLKNVSGADLFDIFHSFGSAGTLYAMLAPYFLSFSLFTKDRNFCRLCQRHFLKRPGPLQEKLNVAHFTDTFHEINGVAKTLQLEAFIAEKKGKPLKMITCGPELKRSHVVNFPPIGIYEVPEYPDLKLFYPPLLKMLEFCYEENFTHIHSATPGPIGLAALAIARILKLPIYGTYHTALPQYVSRLLDDFAMEEITWKYSIWYYNQMDVVYVPSRATAEELATRGIQQDKIRFYDRGVDVIRFHPSKRNGFFRTRFNIIEEDLKLLYVGRVSREKDLPLLVETFRKTASLRPRVRLIVVGDGPYLDEMKTALEGLPVTFTGFLAGEDLAQVYASSDVFVFPSSTDTFGNVVLEAQASGIPVIVTDQGGPRENLINGKTGFVVPAGDVLSFTDTLIHLIDSPDLLRKMKQNARDYMENRSFESAFSALWDSYTGTGSASAAH